MLYSVEFQVPVIQRHPHGGTSPSGRRLHPAPGENSSGGRRGKMTEAALGADHYHRSPTEQSPKTPGPERPEAS